ncbi:MAG: T9SS type A sorting domain-containing protein [Bacteroidia bacterium]|nr:T9SS type A sorting domain-containing protein [Bacteroidia bacterium]
MKKTTISFLLTIIVRLGNAQFNIPTPYVVSNIDWIHYTSQRGNVSNGPTSIDANQNVYSTGYTGNSNATYNILTQKRDSLGNMVFSVQYNNGGFDKGNSIKIHGVFTYVSGVSYSTSGNNDGILLCYNATGGLAWQYRFDNVGQDDEYVDVKTDASQNAYVTAKSMNNSGDYDIVTHKIDASGNLIWSHTFAGTANLDDKPVGLVIIGNYIYVAGNTTDATNGTDWVICQIDKSTGASGWTKQINGASNVNDVLSAVIISGSDIVACGEIDNNGNLDACTIRLDGNLGNVMYQNTYDVGGTNNRATALVRDSTGNIGSVGVALNGSTYEYHTQIMDSLGNQLTVNIESTGLSSLSVDPRIACDTIASHFYVCGEALKATKDMFVYQITPSGNTTWREYIDGQNSDIDAATGLAVNGTGVVYLCGLAKNSTGVFYDFTTAKISQTPVYFPPDINTEPVNYNHLYLPNKGQLLRTDSVLANEVLYYTHNTVPEVFFEQNAFNFVFRRDDNSSANIDTTQRIQCIFNNCNPLAGLHEYLPRSTNHNYFLGYAASPEITNIYGHERIFSPNFYPGIDLHYFSSKGGIKYYFVLKPYAVNEIVMNIDGAESTNIDGTSGNLKINGTMGNVELSKPVFYTVNMLGQIVPISGTPVWTSSGGNTYQIGLPSYNASMPVIIMVEAVQSGAAVGGFGAKANLDYSTLYGSAGGEVFKDIKASANGDRHVTGWADSYQFPTVKNLFSYPGQKDAVILRYTVDDTLRVATYYGGARNDEGTSIAVDNLGGIYVGGYTESSDFKHKFLTGASNQTVSGFVPTVGDYRDGFLAKFTVVNPNSPLQTITHTWGRYLGGSRNDEINAIHIDGGGNLVFTGESRSTTMSAIINAQQATNANTNNSSDVIVGKLNPSLSMVFCTFLGGGNSPYTTASREIGNDITVDNSGRIMVVGRTDALNFPTTNLTGNTNTFFDNTPPGTFDGFLARYSPTGTLQFSSFFGSPGIDDVQRVYYNSNFDEYYFAGYSTDTTGFPFVFKSGALNSKYKINQNAFIAKMDGSLTKQWATYYGKGKGSGKEYHVTGLASDGYGVVYMSGHVTADTLMQPNINPTTTVYKDSVVSARDGYVVIFNPDQSLYHAHYFGSIGDDYIWNSDVSQGQNLYLVGGTRSSTLFPIAYNATNAAYIDSTHNGGDDGFISRFQLINYQVTDVKTFDFDKSSLMVYPNPANSEFVIELEGQEQTKPLLKVFNIMGQLMHQQVITENSTHINCQSWANGVYLVSVSNNNTQSTFKLIKN